MEACLDELDVLFEKLYRGSQKVIDGNRYGDRKVEVLGTEYKLQDRVI